MKRNIKNIIGFLLYIWQRAMHTLPQISSIYFHDPSPELFRSVLEWYKKHHYRFVSLKELKTFLESGTPPHDRVAFISFDDGKMSNIYLLPICDEYNAPITVFVTTEPLISGNYWWEYATKKIGRKKMLTMKKLKEKDFYKTLNELKDGMIMERTSMNIDELKKFTKHPLVTIQSHTVNHPILTNCTDETLRTELIESKRKLEEITGETIDVFSYPNGNVGEREINALKEACYRYAFTTEALKFNIGQMNPYLLPRMAINTNGKKYENLAKLTGIWYSFFSIITTNRLF